MILICGCGRSGTKYITQVLRKCGLDVGHEKLGKDGIVSSLWTIDVDKYPPYHIQGPQPEFDIILHQVRNPLDTIGSLLTSLPESWEFNCRHTPLKMSDPLPKRAAEYWYYWNLLAEKRAIWTYQVESLHYNWDTFCAYLNLDVSYDLIKDIPRNVNTRKHQQIDWDWLERATPEHYKDILRLVVRYGYTTQSVHSYSS